MTVREWALLALGVWVVLFVSGIGVKATSALLEWWKK